MNSDETFDLGGEFSDAMLKITFSSSVMLSYFLVVINKGLRGCSYCIQNIHCRKFLSQNFNYMLFNTKYVFSPVHSAECPS